MTSARGHSERGTGVNLFDAQEWRNTTRSCTATLTTGYDGAGLIPLQVRDVAGVVSAVDTDPLEETRLPNESQELVLDGAVLVLLRELRLAFWVVVDVVADNGHDVVEDNAQQAAQDVSRDFETVI